MLANLIGDVSLFTGLALLVLTLMIPELSRQRDALWAGIFLLIGVVLVTSQDKFSSYSLLAILGAMVIISRLTLEVGQNRWKVLTNEEKMRLNSFERWKTSFLQLGVIFLQIFDSLKLLGTLVGIKSSSRDREKRWVRPDSYIEAKGASGKKSSEDFSNEE